MGRKETLETLLTKVTNETLEYIDSAIIVNVFGDFFNGNTLIVKTIVEPDLNGMETLHKSVLGDRWTRSVDATMPEARILVTLHPIKVVPVVGMVACDGKAIIDVNNMSESRAWLIAIMQALISECD